MNRAFLPATLALATIFFRASAANTAQTIRPRQPFASTNAVAPAAVLTLGGVTLALVGTARDRRVRLDHPGGKKDDVLTVEFTVLGIPCLGLNGGPEFRHSEAFSFQIAQARKAFAVSSCGGGA